MHSLFHQGDDPIAAADVQQFMAGDGFLNIAGQGAETAGKQDDGPPQSKRDRAGK